MSLTVALNTARTALQTTAAQIATSGRNVAGANDPSYSRKIALPVTGADGAAHILSLTRAVDVALYHRMIGATSTAAGQQAVLDGLDQLQQTVGDTDSPESPAAKISVFSNTLQQFANAPDDPRLGRAVVGAASDLASGLNRATVTVQKIRSDADGAIAASVQNVNSLLAKFGSLNAEITSGSAAGADVTSQLDARDAIVSQLSEELGVTAITRRFNDMSLYTDGGVPLFDVTARSVTFQTTPAMAPGVAGKAVVIDGVPVTGDTATMPLNAGRIAGLAQLRDEIAPTYQNQLDEIARGLVATFAESDQSGNGGADAAGLFTWSGGPAIPADGTILPGVAATIRVNSAADPAVGGNVAVIRDGGINGADYSYNATGAASFADRLDALLTGLTAPRAFDPAAQIDASAAIPNYATASVSWLENLRQTASTDNDFQKTLLTRASDALSNATGVNMDDEYAQQIQLEQSYAASSKLIGIVGQLFDQLMLAFR